jgi:hypothetical protein
MFIYRSTQRQIHLVQKPALIRPVVKAMKPVVKRFLSDKPADVPLYKHQENENLLRQTGLTEKSFSFFSDVICHIVPVLKNVK